MEVERLLTQDDRSQAAIERRELLDREIAPLRVCMAQLQSAYDAAEEGRAAEERLRDAEAKRKAQDAEEQERLAVIKHCKELKDKRVVDLTVNDAEFLRDQRAVTRIP